MSELLNQSKRQLRDAVLGNLWSAWSGLGVMGAGSRATGLVDPEVLLLLTLECGREDPRLFDEAIDWLSKHGHWINVTRLTAILRNDQLCDPSILGALAAFLSKHDSSAKWRSPAQRFRQDSDAGTPLFLRNGEVLDSSSAEVDEEFSDYGWLRSPVCLRAMSQAPDLESAPAFMLQCRAMFGVNMRADLWAYVKTSGHGTASHIARELGYTQPRVHEAMNGMLAAGAFQVRQEGNRREYWSIPGRGWPEAEAGNWRDWRAYARCVVAVWRQVFSLREKGLTEYLLDVEVGKAIAERRNDFVLAKMPLDRTPQPHAVIAAFREF